MKKIFSDDKLYGRGKVLDKLGISEPLLNRLLKEKIISKTYIGKKMKFFGNELNGIIEDGRPR